MMDLKTRHLAVNSMLSAMCAVLGYVAVTTGSIKLSFESLPILVAALLGGPLSGMLVGGVGTFIYQLLRFGLSATTPLWILPYAVCGGMTGLYAKKHGMVLGAAQTVFITAAGELVITVLNTFAIYVDSHIYGYYYPALIAGALGFRLLFCFIKSAAFGALLPVLIRHLDFIVCDMGSGSGA